MTKGSAMGNLVPLIILVLVLGILAAVGFVAYSIANDVGSNTRKKMEKRNISFTKDGMKVGVKEVTREQQEDSTQSVLVKVWSNSYFPAYKSRLGWMESKNDSPSSTPAGTPLPTPGSEKRKPFSRAGSSQNPISRTTSTQSTK